jgi:Glycerophosphoryl diester phosphodiesterase
MRNNCEKINRIFKNTLKQNRVLIAAHRGTSGGNIAENTIGAYTCALANRADIIEMDLAKSTDGKFFIFHDGNEKRLLGTEKNLTTMTSEEILSYPMHNSNGHPMNEKVNLFEDVLEALKGKCLINLDRSDRYWDEAIPIIEKHGMLDQVIIKSEPEEKYLSFLENLKTPVMYMPKEMDADAADEILKRDINTVAFETIYTTTESNMLNPVRQQNWKDKGVALWTNALRIKDSWNRSAWHDDNGAILGNPDEHWGWMVDHNFDIIQTDWPLLLRTYLDKKLKK